MVQTPLANLLKDASASGGDISGSLMGPCSERTSNKNQNKHKSLSTLIGTASRGSNTDRDRNNLKQVRSVNHTWNKKTTYFKMRQDNGTIKHKIINVIGWQHRMILTNKAWRWSQNSMATLDGTTSHRPARLRSLLEPPFRKTRIKIKTKQNTLTFLWFELRCKSTWKH